MFLLGTGPMLNLLRSQTTRDPRRHSSTTSSHLAIRIKEVTAILDSCRVSSITYLQRTTVSSLPKGRISRQSIHRDFLRTSGNSAPICNCLQSKAQSWLRALRTGFESQLSLLCAKLLLLSFFTVSRVWPIMGISSDRLDHRWRNCPQAEQAI